MLVMHHTDCGWKQWMDGPVLDTVLANHHFPYKVSTLRMAVVLCTTDGASFRMLPVVHKNGDTDSAEDFCHRVEQEIAGALGLTVSNIKSADLKKWLSRKQTQQPLPDAVHSKWLLNVDDGLGT